VHIAIQAWSRELTREIISHGGNVNLLDAGGSSALHCLAKLPLEMLHGFTLDTFLFLKRKGADMFLENDAAEAPRWLAIKNGWPAYLI
jgi:hypothetical protein